jgi:hypothetical protein
LLEIFVASKLAFIVMCMAGKKRPHGSMTCSCGLFAASIPLSDAVICCSAKLQLDHDRDGLVCRGCSGHLW